MTVSASWIGHRLCVKVSFRVVVEVKSCRSLILLLGLYLAAIAFLAKGEVEVITVKTNPIALSGLGSGFC